MHEWRLHINVWLHLAQCNACQMSSISHSTVNCNSTTFRPWQSSSGTKACNAYVGCEWQVMIRCKKCASARQYIRTISCVGAVLADGWDCPSAIPTCHSTSLSVGSEGSIVTPSLSTHSPAPSQWLWTRKGTWHLLPACNCGYGRYIYTCTYTEDPHYYESPYTVWPGGVLY